MLAHGEFLDALLAPSDGFLLLALHNLFCQAVNFDVPADVLAHAMPLERVREVHLSGGRWATLASPDGPQRFRRDTHDDRIPDDVFALLELVRAARGSRPCSSSASEAPCRQPSTASATAKTTGACSTSSRAEGSGAEGLPAEG